MAKPRAKKPEPAPPPEVRVLPMKLQVGDILSDYTTAGGKTVHVRVESVKQRGVTNVGTWGAHER